MKMFLARGIGEVALTDERHRHITERHPETKPYLRFLAKTLANPETIRQSRYDPAVLLFYRRVPRNSCLVAVIQTTQRFILTVYLTDYIVHTQKI